LIEILFNPRDLQMKQVNSKRCHGNDRIAARDTKKGSDSLSGYAGSALKLCALKGNRGFHIHS
jgi:hypothetical protein